MSPDAEKAPYAACTAVGMGKWMRMGSVEMGRTAFQSFRPFQLVNGVVKKGKCTGLSPMGIMGKSMNIYGFRLRFSLKPIHWSGEHELGIGGYRSFWEAHKQFCGRDCWHCRAALQWLDPLHMWHHMANISQAAARSRMVYRMGVVDLYWLAHALNSSPNSIWVYRFTKKWWEHPKKQHPLTCHLSHLNGHLILSENVWYIRKMASL